MTNAYVRESQRLYRVLGIIKGAERGKMNSMHGCGLQNRQDRGIHFRHPLLLNHTQDGTHNSPSLRQ